MEKRIVKLKDGYGYWDTTKYPLGGCFRRVVGHLMVEITGNVPKRFKGCDYYGKTIDGNTLAFSIDAIDH